MHIYIAICDDEKDIAGELESKLEEMLKCMNLKYSIDVFFSGTRLISAVKNGQHFDLIFLDIEFAEDEINGVEVGRLIRDTYSNNEISIVFISREKRYHDDLFDLQPLNFLFKPLNYVKVDKVLRKYMDIAGLRSSTITYKIKQDVFKVKVKDVVYVESIDRKLIIHHNNGEQSGFYGSLKELFAIQLSKYDFILISSSYAINFDYIIHYTYDEVRLNGIDASFQISQNRRKDVRAKFLSIELRRER